MQIMKVAVGSVNALNKNRKHYDWARFGSTCVRMSTHACVHACVPALYAVTEVHELI